MKTAVVILDLNGRIVGMRSERGFSLERILEFLSSECTPLVIASDVFPAPRLVEKVAAAFSAKVYAPQENFSKRTKSRIVRSFGLSERERHKKDALAAAVTAYGCSLPVINRIKKKLLNEGVYDIFDAGDVMKKILSGESGNIHSAISSLKTESCRIEAANNLIQCPAR
ncbi:MAG: DUF460 domain-containing protein [Candidatus Aenigmarchaeota archaeon]|nr:DUF460 domain-containing protein [Candidatus Aenigmarchaeota archaeon]